MERKEMNQINPGDPKADGDLDLWLQGWGLGWGLAKIM